MNESAWAIRASYCLIIGATPGQAIFGRDMVFNIASVVYWQAITTKNSNKSKLIMFTKKLGESDMTMQLVI